MNIKVKKALLLQNNSQCKYGYYKNFQMVPPIKNYYDGKFNLYEPVNFCDVLVKHIHPLLFIKDLKMAGHNPVIVSTVSNEFDGSNIDTLDGFNDDLIITRTNFCKTVPSHSYPLHGPEVIYTSHLGIIRDDTMTFVNPNQLISFSHIVISPIENPTLSKKKLKLDDYIFTRELIETIFQTAYLGKNDILILNDFGCKYNKIPLQDIIDLYNYNILKYGHLFKYIIISIPLLEQSDQQLYMLFDKEIIKPQNLVNPDSIDMSIFNKVKNISENYEEE
jgi:hypothetical protein